MKFWLLLFFLFALNQQHLVAQTDSIPPKTPIFKAGFYLGSNYTIPQSPNINDPSYSITGRSEWGYEIGLRATFQISRFIYFSSGLSCGEIRYHTNVFGGNQYYNGNPYILDMSTTAYYYSMPLILAGHIRSGKFEFYLGIGAEVTEFYKYLEEGQVTINGQLSSVNNVGGKHPEIDFSIRPGLMAGLNYRKSNRIDFFAEMGVKDEKFGEGYFNNLYSGFLNVGFMYSIFRKSST
jgi:hypothetical protein